MLKYHGSRVVLGSNAVKVRDLPMSDLGQLRDAVANLVEFLEDYTECSGTTWSIREPHFQRLHDLTNQALIAFAGAGIRPPLAAQDAGDPSHVAYQEIRDLRASVVCVIGGSCSFLPLGTSPTEFRKMLGSVVAVIPADKAGGSGPADDGTTPNGNSAAGTTDAVPLAQMSDSGPIVNAGTYAVTWQGRSCRLGNNQEFRMMKLLVESPGRYVEHATMAEKLVGSEFAEIKHIKSRLVKKLRAEGMGDLADAIRTEFGNYGLFLS